MVGGTVIENVVTRNSETGAFRRRLWCADRRSSDECAVFADCHEAEDVQPGDWIWWQSGKIYWTRHVDGDPDKGSEFVEREIRKIGFSFDPRRDACAG